MSTNIQVDTIILRGEKIQKGVCSRIQFMSINMMCSDGCVHMYIKRSGRAYKNSYQTRKNGHPGEDMGLGCEGGNKANSLTLTFFQG